MIRVIPDTKNKQIEFKLKRIKPYMLKYIRSALFEIGAENTQQIKKFIYAPPKTGRFYRFEGRWHQASAPGESPANRSGFLARSIDYKVHSHLEVELHSTAFYANYLEDGVDPFIGKARNGVTYPHPGIKPRPYFIRAVNKKKRDNLRSLEKHVYNNLIKP